MGVEAGRTGGVAVSFQKRVSASLAFCGVLSAIVGSALGSGRLGEVGSACLSLDFNVRSVLIMPSLVGLAASYAMMAMGEGVR